MEILSAFLRRRATRLARRAFALARVLNFPFGQPAGDGRVLERAVGLARSEAGADPLGFSPSDAPLISFVVPVYNTPTEYLDDLLESIRLQPEGRWQLILSDDGSQDAETRAWLARIEAEAAIKVVRAAKNGGIARATNAGIARATGRWIALLDHDDAIAPYAVERIMRALAERPDCQFLYTDEVITDRFLRPVAAFLKPAFDPVLLSGVNYINHLSLYRRERLLALGGVREGFDGSQDYDLLLRYVRGLGADAIVHLPYPAYLWRRDGAGYSAKYLDRATVNARRALGEHYASPAGAPAVVPALNPDLHRVDFAGLARVWPKVSVIIPSRDALRLIRQVLDGLIRKTDYPNLEIIVIDNGSTDPEVLALYRQHAGGPVAFRAEINPEAFNFSRAVNRGIALATGDLILLLNNDIEITAPGWLREMVSCLDYPAAGIVGAKLLYPDGTLQHAGVIAGLGGLAGHWYIGRDGDFPGPMGRLRVRQSLSCVTGACMLIARACLEAVGRFDEDNFAIAYNDIDFCLRARGKGFRVIWTPFAELVHHESASRGSDETPENIGRFKREQANLQRIHATDRFEDPAFNPWYTKGRSDPILAPLSRLPAAR